MNENVHTQYGFAYVKPGSGIPERHSGWFEREVDRDESAQKFVGTGHIVTLQEKNTITTQRVTGILKPIQPDPEAEARKRVLATPPDTLFLGRSGIYRRVTAKYNGEVGLARVTSGRSVEFGEISSKFFQSLKRLIPEGE